MKLYLKKYLLIAASLVALLGLSTGCGTPGGGSATTGGPVARTGGEATDYTESELIRVGDVLGITYRGTVSMTVQDQRQQVSDDGNINVEHLGPVKAAGMTRVALQREIQEALVPKYYRNLTVTISPDQRFFYVYGEVNNPARHPYTGPIKVLEAIAVAGDFTQFAKKTEVKLIRTDGTSQIVDCVRALDNPSLNVEVLPGDTIHVKQSFWGID